MTALLQTEIQSRRKEFDPIFKYYRQYVLNQQSTTEKKEAKRVATEFLLASEQEITVGENKQESKVDSLSAGGIIVLCRLIEIIEN